MTKKRTRYIFIMYSYCMSKACWHFIEFVHSIWWPLPTKLTISTCSDIDHKNDVQIVRSHCYGSMRNVARTLTVFNIQLLYSVRIKSQQTNGLDGEQLSIEMEKSDSTPITEVKKKKKKKKRKKGHLEEDEVVVQYQCLESEESKRAKSTHRGVWVSLCLWIIRRRSS